MTIVEAIEKGIQRLRMANWNEFRYLELDLVADGEGGFQAMPFAVLYDPQASCMLNQKIGLNVPLLSKEMAEEKRYIEFTGYSPVTLDKLREMRSRHNRTDQEDLTSVERETDQ